MGPLAAVERFLERLFERQTARLFKTAIRPIQVQRKLERAMEGSRSRNGSRTLVPHRFIVRLTAADLEAVRAATPSLAADLADGALAFARGHGYSLLDRPAVKLQADATIEPGDIVVDATDSVVIDRPSELESAVSPAASPDEDQSSAASPLDRPSVAVDRARTLDRGEATADQTAVFVLPTSDGPLATIREVRADGSSRQILFDGRPLTIGRAPDNRLVIRDGRASRHHARIDGRRGSLVLSDLGSTNGSFVNDRRVDSVALGAGDRIRIGTTALLVEAVASDPLPGPAEDNHPRGDGSAPDG
jgi:hypothetical protein